MPARARPRPPTTEDATLLRVFLSDGTSLVSYGEPARGRRPRHVLDADRGDAESAAAAGESAPDRVDWTRTKQYASPPGPRAIVNAGRARLRRAVQPGRADAERRRRDPPIPPRGSRSSSARARRSPSGRRRITTTGWPKCGRWSHARRGDRRSARGRRRQPVQPRADGARRSAGDDRAAAAAADAAGIDRAGAARGARRGQRGRAHALLSTALASLDRDKAALPADWVAGDARRTERRIEREVRIDRAYRALTSASAAADRRARAA